MASEEGWDFASSICSREATRREGGGTAGAGTCLAPKAGVVRLEGGTIAGAGRWALAAGDFGWSSCSEGVG